MGAQAEYYGKLFPNEKVKAEAFDKIARNYYIGNFGTMQKAELDLLMFSLYIERILYASEENMSTYSDYTLAKLLGITQSRVSSLKVKKEMKYPYNRFDWRKAFERISQNARYENGKIKLFVSDINLFLELKNAIETNNGYIDVQLNSKLLCVSPEYFVDLLLIISNDEDKKTIKKRLRAELQAKNIDVEFFDTKPVGKLLKENAASIGTEVLLSMLESCVPIVGPFIGNTIRNVVKVIKDN